MRKKLEIKFLPAICAFVVIFFPGALHSSSVNPREKVLEASVDSRSISEALAFYHLFGKSPLVSNSDFQKLTAKNALSMAKVLSGEVVAAELMFSKEQIRAIDELCKHFPTKKLKGSLKAPLVKPSLGLMEEDRSQSLKPFSDLSADEIDLGCALITMSPDLSIDEKEQYLKALDLIAYQIEKRLPEKPSNSEKVDAISDFIFFELGIRFPPESSYSPEIDRYTDIASIIASRRGVCLGVSALYLCIAQRLDLRLDIVTPPGHIYVSFEGRNIETTARGLNLPDEAYHSIHTKSLQKRTLKEVVGLVLFNRASSMLHRKEYEKALSEYELAAFFMPEDALLMELTGMASMLTGKRQKAHKLLKASVKAPKEHAFCQSAFVQDILSARCDKAALEVIFTSDEHESPIACAKRLEKELQPYPNFAAGFLHLAGAYLKEGASVKAEKALIRYQSLNREDPIASYLLARLAIERFDYEKAWKHLREAEEITKDSKVRVKALIELKCELFKKCPEPRDQPGFTL